MTLKVYLAGPISGLTLDKAQAWRSVFAKMLPEGIRCYSPLREKDFLRGKGTLEQSYGDHALSTDRGIMTRDHNDCRTADAIVVNLLRTERVSIGTVMEIAWGHAYKIPVIAIMEPDGNPHDHPMIREAIGYRVPGIHEAAAITRAVLLP